MLRLLSSHQQISMLHYMAHHMWSVFIHSARNLIRATKRNPHQIHFHPGIYENLLQFFFVSNILSEASKTASIEKFCFCKNFGHPHTLSNPKTKETFNFFDECGFFVVSFCIWFQAIIFRFICFYSVESSLYLCDDIVDVFIWHLYFCVFTTLTEWWMSIGKAIAN